jgi:glutaredoxin
MNHRSITAVVVLAWLPLTVAAQALYKIIGPDGRITYSDQAPAGTSARVTALTGDGRAASAAPAASGASASARATNPTNAATGPQSALPTDLRGLVSRYPVTLYAASDCAPCTTGRNLLRQRGIPFSEKIVDSDDDVDAMSRITGARTLPALTVGKQALRGYAEADWTEFLDAAGYPRESHLPRGYVASPATPLVARQAESPPTTADRSRPNREDRFTPTLPPPPPEPDASGIRF